MQFFHGDESVEKQVGLATPDLTFLTPDHPEACGREPEEGDEAYIIHFPLEHGRVLAMHMGKIGFEHLVIIVRQLLQAGKGV